MIIPKIWKIKHFPNHYHDMMVYGEAMQIRSGYIGASNLGEIPIINKGISPISPPPLCTKTGQGFKPGASQFIKHQIMGYPLLSF